jgi:1-acyl-sn-glycerol-3-phosphate acyltransferase
MHPVTEKTEQFENELTFGNQHLRFDFSLYKRWQKRCIRWASWARVRSFGVDKINKQGPVLITPNHISWKDIFFVGGMIRRTVHFAATYRLFDEDACHGMLDYYFGKLVRYRALQRTVHFCNGFLAKFLVTRVRGSGALPAKLHSKNYSFLDAIKNAFRQEKLVCIFPEGRTGPPGKLYRFKLGISKILHDYYLENQVSIPVYPIGITGTHQYYHPGMKLGFFVGSPLYIHDYLQSSDFETYLSFTKALRDAVTRLIDQK